MDFFAWVILGLLIGLVGYLSKSKDQIVPISGMIILGIIGSLTGGFLGNILFGVDLNGFNTASFFIAFLGALGILYTARTIIKTS